MGLELGAVGQINHRGRDILNRGLAIVGRRAAEHRVLASCLDDASRLRWHERCVGQSEFCEGGFPHSFRPWSACRWKRSTSRRPWRAAPCRRWKCPTAWPQACHRLACHRQISHRQIWRPPAVAPVCSARAGQGCRTLRLWAFREPGRSTGLRRVDRRRRIRQSAGLHGPGGSPCGDAAANLSLNMSQPRRSPARKSTGIHRQRRKYRIELRPRRPCRNDGGTGDSWCLDAALLTVGYMPAPKTLV